MPSDAPVFPPDAFSCLSSSGPKVYFKLRPILCRTMETTGEGGWGGGGGGITVGMVTGRNSSMAGRGKFKEVSFRSLAEIRL